MAPGTSHARSVPPGAPGPRQSCASTSSIDGEEAPRFPAVAQGRARVCREIWACGAGLHSPRWAGVGLAVDDLVAFLS